MSLHGLQHLRLTDSELLLRPYEVADAAALYDAVKVSATHLSPWLPWVDRYRSTADAQAWIAESRTELQAGRAVPLGVFDTTAGHLMGGVGLSDYQSAHGVANLGYWRGLGAAHRGVATRAARLLAQHALTALDLRGIEICVAIDNAPSQRVAQRLGARHEGVLQDRLRIRQHSVNAHFYSLVRSDFGE
jgi:RimJ/RimL family protein N-acetyltransferase